MHDPAYQKEGPVTEYEMPDGRHVKITERVTAFHRAQQRNDVEMIFYVTDARRERRAVGICLDA